MNLFDLEMWHYVFVDIWAERGYLPGALMVGGGIYLLVRLVWRFTEERRPEYRHGHKRCGVMAVWLAYLFVIAGITLMGRETGSRLGMDLGLFDTLGGARANAYVMENVLLFIPFGFLTACLRRHLGGPAVIVAVTAAAALASLGIEGIQLITERGYFQVDDIVMNTVGGMVGSLLWWAAGGIWSLVRR